MYWNNRAKTKATFAGEWTRSGDKYTRDADGYYTYGGRSDDMLKVGGIYVSPFEVEAASPPTRRCSIEASDAPFGEKRSVARQRPAAARKID